MKKSILRFGALALMSLMSISAFAQGFTEFVYYGNTYRITKSDPSKTDPNQSGEVTLIKWTSGNSVGDAKVEDSFGNDYKVTRILGNTYKANGTIDQQGAFYGVAPGYVYIGADVTTIEANAFKSITDNAQIQFADLTKLTNIGNNAFTPASGKTVEIQESYLDLRKSTLGEGAFERVTFSYGARVELGDITSVPKNLFKGCALLEAVFFSPSKLLSVGESAFEGCTNMSTFGYQETTMDVYLPACFTQVGDKAFKDCSILWNLAFSAAAPNSKIRQVGAEAFSGCTWLDNAHFCNLFPATLESTKVKVTPFTYGSAAFASTALIGEYDFSACNYGIFNDAFKGNGITKVVLPTGVQTIDKEALKDCASLTTCALPITLTTIEAGAFQNTDAYVSVFIPNTVTFIGKDAFSRANESATSARTITIQANESTTNPSVVSTVINSWSKSNSGVYSATAPIADYTNTKLVVPMSLMKAYAVAANPTGDGKKPGNYYNWSGAAASALYTYGNALTPGIKFYNGAFEYTVAANWDPQYAVNLGAAPTVTISEVCQWKEFTVGTNKTKNGKFKWGTEAEGTKYTSMFSGPALNIPKTVVRAGENNKNQFIYYTVTGISTAAFNDVPSIPQGATNVVKYLLKENVTELNIQANELDLTDVFTGFKALETVNFRVVSNNGWVGSNSDIPANQPAKVTLGNNAFKDCVALKAFNNNTVKYAPVIGEYAFNNTALEEFEITEGVTELQFGAFFKSKLTSINIPASVNIIGSSVFDGTHTDEYTDDFIGVRDIYVNWPADNIKTWINNDAFGNEVWHWIGNKQEYLPRRLYIPAGSAAFYSDTDNGPFSKTHLFTLGEAIELKSKLNESGRLDVEIDVDNDTRTLAFTDDNTIEKLGVLTADEDLVVNYTRKFEKTSLQAWFVPFTLKDGGKNGATFYKIYDTEEGVAADGTPCTNLELVEEKGDVKANRPYIVKPAAVGEVTFNAVGIEKTDDSKAVVVSDIKNEYTIKGIYAKINSGSTGGLNPVPANPFYAISDGAFHPAKINTPLYGCRLFLTASELTDPYEIKFHILSDEDVTAIENVKANSLNAPMFDLMGRQIAAPAKGQVYIQNGVKKLAK